MDCVRGLAGQSQYATLMQHSKRLPEQGAFLIRHSNKFIGECVRCCVIFAVDMCPRYREQCVHQRGSFTDLPRILECALGVP